MASLIGMYSSSSAPDISGDLRNLRQEERDRNAKNWQGSRDLLRSVATDEIRGDYADGISWDGSVKNADTVFKKQYERLMSVDPAAAERLKADYLAERGRRVNAEVAAAHDAGAKAVDGDIAAIEAEIARLEAEVADEEDATRESARLEAEASKAQPLLPGLVPSVGPLSDQTPEAAPWSSPIDGFIPREQPPMRFGLRNLYAGGR